MKAGTHVWTAHNSPSNGSGAEVRVRAGDGVGVRVRTRGSGVVSSSPSKDHEIAGDGQVAGWSAARAWVG
eukprot:scaffold27274_cov18-Phaeocystis_antarctica.AAC.1